MSRQNQKRGECGGAEVSVPRTGISLNHGSTPTLSTKLTAGRPTCLQAPNPVNEATTLKSPPRGQCGSMSTEPGLWSLAAWTKISAPLLTSWVTQLMYITSGLWFLMRKIAYSPRAT